jgi:hypothetical protein
MLNSLGFPKIDCNRGDQPCHPTRWEENLMKSLCFLTLVLSSCLLAAQDGAPANSGAQDMKDSKGQITVQGCVSRASGDYILMKQDPGMSYELQATGKIKLHHYMGQRVEVTGTQSPSMSTSSDSSARAGNPSSVTLTITSIRTIDKECTAH